MNVKEILNFYFCPKGRVSRKGIWIQFASLTAVMVVIHYMGIVSDSLFSKNENYEQIIDYEAYFELAVIVILYTSCIMVGIKRLHDRNLSGWVMLFITMGDGAASEAYKGFTGPSHQIMWPYLLVFLAVLIVRFQMYFLPGVPGPNKYGTSPVATVA